jgi:hypothetical protein
VRRLGDSLHLLEECVALKALWFRGRWSLRIDYWPAASILQLVHIVVEPLAATSNKHFCAAVVIRDWKGYVVAASTMSKPQ